MALRRGQRREAFWGAASPPCPTALRDVQALMALWRNDYNQWRLHSSLGYQNPAAFAAGFLAGAQA